MKARGVASLDAASLYEENLLQEGSAVWFNSLEVVYLGKEDLTLGHKKTDLAGSVHCASEFASRAENPDED